MADVKTMAQGDKSVGREVPIAMKTDTPATPGNYADFSSSKTVQGENTYTEGRRSTLEAALGNKDSVKG